MQVYNRSITKVRAAKVRSITDNKGRSKNQKSKEPLEISLVAYKRLIIFKLKKSKLGSFSGQRQASFSYDCLVGMYIAYTEIRESHSSLNQFQHVPLKVRFQFIVALPVPVSYPTRPPCSFTVKIHRRKPISKWIRRCSGWSLAMRTLGRDMAFQNRNRICYVLWERWAVTWHFKINFFFHVTFF